MPIRKPVVAGRFYSGNPLELRKDVEHYISASKHGEKEKAWGVMLPHAGYIYCGDIIGKTLANVELPPRLVILCPNHTGYGKPLGVWPDGSWLTPLGQVNVDGELAAEIVNTGKGFEFDVASHMGEHSIEVLLPFLQASENINGIVPICVGTANATILKRAAQGLAQVLKQSRNKNVGIVVSSDMNHYEEHKRTLQKDELALDCALATDPDALLDVTARNHISMCGAAPLALALYAARDLGKPNVVLTGHSTSGPVSGDFEHTVGYAGLVLDIAS